MALDPQTIGKLQGLGRVAFGAALTFVPERAGGSWIGSSASRPGVGVITSATGIRDMALGAGQASALFNGGDARPWLRAGAACDLVDLVATLRARSDLPTGAVVGVTLVATGSIAIGAWLHATL